ncbi:hypothetical protein BGS_0105 [Beggiatoa sp. SS]|nr:hypothetical protein BGS_0105 [Beggiatoa sp. SS]
MGVVPGGFNFIRYFGPEAGQGFLGGLFEDTSQPPEEILSV